MAIFDLVQAAAVDAGSGATSREATLGSAPTEGNTLVAFLGHRSPAAGDAGDASLSTEGWSLVADSAVDLAGSHPRVLAVWMKPVGASEPASLEVTFPENISAVLILQEREGELEVDQVDLDDTGTNITTSLGVGPTDETTEDDELALGFFVWRGDPPNRDYSDDFDDEVTGSSVPGQPTNTLFASYVEKLLTETDEVEVAATWDTNNRATSGAVVTLAAAGDGPEHARSVGSVVTGILVNS